MNPVNAKQTFLDIKRVLDQLGIKFWLVDGTVLGAVREGCFITGDLDIDLRILAVDFDYDMIAVRFNAAGFKYHNVINKPKYGDMSAGMVATKRGIKCHICIGYYYPPAKELVVLAAGPLSNVSVLPASMFKNDEDYFVEFMGVKVRVPNPPERYLEIRYGHGWKTPKNEKFRHECLPISLTKYVNYFRKHPKVNQKDGR